MSNSLKKDERLKSRKRISQLFAGKKTIKKGSFILYFDVDTSDDLSIKISISASKKKMPRAVDRNRMKRLMREAFSLQKESFLANFEGENVQMALMLICLSEKLLSFEETQEKIKLILSRLNREIKSIKT